MFRLFASAVALVLAATAFTAARADDNATDGGADGGVVTIESAHDVPTTIDRLAAAVEGAGGTVFARVDHAKGAASVDLELRPTELLIFGNPKLGTLPMQQAQTVGVDLPLRVLAWEDEAGVTHVSYTDPAAMMARHGVAPDAPFVAKIAGALEKLTGKATGKATGE